MGLTRRRFATVLAASTAGLAAGSWSRTAAAATLSAEASLDTDRARVGEPVELTLVVRREGGGSAPKPSLPADIQDNFEILSTKGGTSFQQSIGTGGIVAIATREVVIVLAPKKAGTFELSFQVEDGSDRAESNEVVLEVVDAGARLPGDPAQGTEPTDPRGDLFVWASLDKTEAYVGEQITYLLDMYLRRQVLDVDLRKPPVFGDFFSEPLPDGQVRRARVGDVPYQVQPLLRRALFAQRAGTLEIGAAEITVGFRRKRLPSQTLTVEVKPLPAEGQPPSFSPNNVGTYTIAASVDRTDLTPGDPFTLTVTIEGTGNIKLIDPGAWPRVDGARRYDPKVDTKMSVGRELGGTRTWTFLMIPERAGSITIPEHVFDFFDPKSGAYERVASAPLEVVVSGTVDTPPAAAEAEPSEDAGQPAEIAPVIAGDTLPRHLPRQRWLTDDRWLVGMVSVPAAATVGLVAGALWRRFGPDEAARSRALDRQRRKRRLEAAEASVASGDGFHAEVAGLLQELAVRRAGPEGVGLPRPELLRLLGRQGVDASELRRLADLLGRCDAARFAAQRGTAAERRELLDDVLALVRGSLGAEGAR
jgi:hypothetical protein